jgi:hypothetical protein
MSCFLLYLISSKTVSYGSVLVDELNIFLHEDLKLTFINKRG